MHARRPFKEAKSLFRLLCCCLIISLKCFLGIDRVLELDGWIRVFFPRMVASFVFPATKTLQDIFLVARSGPSLRLTCFMLFEQLCFLIATAASPRPLPTYYLPLGLSLGAPVNVASSH